MSLIGLKVAGKLRRMALGAVLSEQMIGFIHETGRTGECDRCGECCKILFRCPFYDDAKGCTVYDHRPPSCRLYPIIPADLKEVSRCSYSFENAQS
jgi:Fe-S-cluster containining protein